MHGAAGLTSVERATYFGGFSLAVANHSYWRRRIPAALDRVLWFSMRTPQQVVLLPFRDVHWYPETRALSPWIKGLYARRSAA